jgi:2-polyprenyl-3-methyl-5-hydroxy-6-metoxy-1,4-benzoquinol methylase
MHEEIARPGITRSNISTSCTQISSYYDVFRSDIIDIVPADAKRVLSVGCGAAQAEAELTKHGIKVVGVEIDPKAAEVARQRGIIILEGDASEIDVDVGSEFYDCLIYADVLEHLPDPLIVLRRHVATLKPNGIVYVSIPNFRHYSIFWQLFVVGHIDYKDKGILDRTHLRITTRKMVCEWFEQVGIELVNYMYIMHRRRERVASACFLGLAKEFIANQIGLVGRKP